MAFKMNGMNFGGNLPRMGGNVARNLEGITPRSALLSNGDDTTKKNYDSKSKTRKIFGRDRTVTKYYDPETGQYKGKKVQVTKKDGSKKLYKDRHGNVSDEKTKRVNTGMTREGGMFKIREKKGYFDSPVEETTASTTEKPGRVEYSKKSDALKDFVKTDPETGEESLASYKQAWADKDRWETFEKDGKKMRKDKFGNVYDDDTGYEAFETASKKYWSDMADKEEGKKELEKGKSELRRDTQTGKMDSPMTKKKKKKGFKMKGSPFKNYKKGYYGIK